MTKQKPELSKAEWKMKDKTADYQAGYRAGLKAGAKSGREECAKLCEGLQKEWNESRDYDTEDSPDGNDCAAMIRSLSK